VRGERDRRQKVMKLKRRLFDELMEGVDAMREEREGKITLRSHQVEDLPPLEIDAELIRDTRERMRVSRAVGQYGLRNGDLPCGTRMTV
jgi:putative transcriptional regulator